jgi:hypothetical protein
MIKQWHSPNRKQHLRKIFFSNFATAPWPEHADWIFKAMMASGQIPEDTKAPKNLKSAYDWTTYQEVMGVLNLALPTDSDTPTDLPKI